VSELYIKYKDEDEYHCCEECLEKIGKLDANGNATEEGIEDKTREEPDGKICSDCKNKKKTGKCTLAYIKTSSVDRG